jgi:hypothetical protein
VKELESLLKDTIAREVPVLSSLLYHSLLHPSLPSLTPHFQMALLEGTETTGLREELAKVMEEKRVQAETLARITQEKAVQAETIIRLTVKMHNTINSKASVSYTRIHTGASK